jgi:pyruvate-ferredoxin/flavodoxin oxidoreductase
MQVGLLKVHLFRPWSAEHFLAGLPKTAKKIAVLDRTKEQGSLGEPLYLDVATTLAKEAIGNSLSLVWLDTSWLGPDSAASIP